MADSSCTRDDRRERIVAECNAVRQALQDLLSEYMGNVSILCPVCLFSFCVFLTPCDYPKGGMKAAGLKAGLLCPQIGLEH